MKNWILLVLAAVLSVGIISCSAEHKDSAEAARAITITIVNDATIRVNEEPVALTELAAKLNQLGCDAGTEVKIVPAKDVSMGTIQGVQEVLRSLQITQVAYDANIQ